MTNSKESGFTLVEILVALLVMGIVMAAITPVFYGLLRSTSSSTQRSIANGLGVSATEQIRSVPYFEVGFYTTPGGCTASNPVVLPNTVSAPMASFPTSKTVGGTTYTLQRCVYWVDSTISGDTQAYKQSIVTVTWSGNGLNSSVTQTSALYPGGQTNYSGPQNNMVGATTTTTAGVPPSPPTALTATPDSVAPANTIDLTWTAPTAPPTPAYYVVYYTTNNPGGCSTSGGYTYCNPIPSLGAGAYSTSSNITATLANITVGPSTTYYFQVISVTSGQASTTTSNTAVATSAASNPTSGTTTTTSLPQCLMNSLTVTPSQGSNGRGVALNNSGYLVNETSFGLSVNVSGPCTNVKVAYAPTGCTPGANGCTSTTYATMSGSGGTWYGTAGTSSTVWAVGTQIFTLYVGASPYSPLTQQQVITCTENGNSGKC